MSRRRNCCCNSYYGGYPGCGFGGYPGGFGGFNNCGCYTGGCGYPYNSLIGQTCLFNSPLLIALLLLGNNRFFRC
ncbi:hypothetical protein [Clostridium paridis]|uniref:Uncharacterized protein n=1 Tax=Clostridium paridis TaxID=2803863 RepID=A0A937FFA3_9CLOT|nr:hypothetical protein [Clostridium paridis]MBL4930933.1 hypothetical protein [Clostridium paridis]